MVRKTVTLVFCDVADSTPLGEQLDPEALRGVWSRYHETAREVLERHGGTIEKFVGDAVLGVFGIPVVHEDDALRAVRAAVELREELARLNDSLDAAFGVRIGVRTGVHTGEVFAGDPAQGDPFATGDAVVVAQRLEATAAPGEILAGDATIRLVRDAVTVEPVPALELKGKSDARRRLAPPRRRAGRRRSRAPARLAARGPCRRARCAARGARARDRRPHLPDRDHRRRAGSGQVAAGGGARLDRRAKTRSCSRAAASRTATGSRTGRSSSSSATLDLDAILGGEPDGATAHGRVLEAVGRAEPRSRSDELYCGGPPAAARRSRASAAARARPRRHPVGGAGLPRPRRVPRRLEPRRTDPRLLPRAPRPRGAAAGLDGHDDPARAAAARAGAGAAREPRRAARPGRGRRGLRARPAATRSSSRRCCECSSRTASSSNATGGSSRSPPSTPCASRRRCRRCSRPASTGSTTDELAVLQRAAVIGQVFWWGAVADLSPPERGRRGRGPAPGARPQGADQARRAHVRGRGRLPLRPHPDPRRRLRLDAEAPARRAARALRRPGRSSAQARAPELDEIIGHHLEQAYRVPARARPGGLGRGERSRVVPPTGWRARAGALSAAGTSTRPPACSGARRPARDGRPPLVLDLVPELGLVLTPSGAARDAESVLTEADRPRRARRTGAARGPDRARRARLRSDPVRMGGDLRLVEAAAARARGGPGSTASGHRALARGWFLVGLVRGLWAGRVGRGEDALAPRPRMHAARRGRPLAGGGHRRPVRLRGLVGPAPGPRGDRRSLALLEHVTGTTSCSRRCCRRWIGCLRAPRGPLRRGAGARSRRPSSSYDELGARLDAWPRALGRADIELLAGDAPPPRRALREGYGAAGRAGRGRATSPPSPRMLAETLGAAGRSEEADARRGAASRRPRRRTTSGRRSLSRIARARASWPTPVNSSGQSSGRARGARDRRPGPTRSLFARRRAVSLAAALTAAGREDEAAVTARDGPRALRGEGKRGRRRRARRARSSGGTESERRRSASIGPPAGAASAVGADHQRDADERRAS